MSMKKAFGFHHKPHSGNNSAANSDTEGTGTGRMGRIGTSLSSISNGMHSRSPKRQSLDSPSRGSTDLSHRSSLKEGHHRTHTPLGMLRRKLRSNSDTSHSSTEDLPMNQSGEPMSKNQHRKHEKMVEKEQHRKEAEERKSQHSVAPPNSMVMQS